MDKSSVLLDSPYVHRNAGPIAEVLSSFLPAEGNILETASGTGQHLVYFAEKFEHLVWFGTDRRTESILSLEGWIAERQIKNVGKPFNLDVGVVNWWKDVKTIVQGELNCILNINMAHISEWGCTQRLIAGAKELLPEEGFLYFYGPWWQDGKPKAISNLQFDESLKERDPTWGIREVEELEEALGRDFSILKTVEMPANNLSIICKKT